MYISRWHKTLKTALTYSMGFFITTASPWLFSKMDCSISSRILNLPNLALMGVWEADENWRSVCMKLVEIFVGFSVMQTNFIIFERITSQEFTFCCLYCVYVISTAIIDIASMLRMKWCVFNKTSGVVVDILILCTWRQMIFYKTRQKFFLGFLTHKLVHFVAKARHGMAYTRKYYIDCTQQRKIISLLSILYILCQTKQHKIPFFVYTILYNLYWGKTWRICFCVILSIP